MYVMKLENWKTDFSKFWKNGKAILQKFEKLEADKWIELPSGWF